ncbi:MAG TPA: hypothetical protein VMS08_01460 [Candidatus Saccharimonadia bacterium]|nr:hypothetical protein [Candidatus Saccharimonadia bacterium]
MGDTYEVSANRIEAAHALAFDMARDPQLAKSINAKNHLSKRDQLQATTELMAKVALPDLEKAQRAETAGDQKTAIKYRTRAYNRMNKAAYRADFGVDAAKMVKKYPWQLWK